VDAAAGPVQFTRSTPRSARQGNNTSTAASTKNLCLFRTNRPNWPAKSVARKNRALRWATLFATNHLGEQSMGPILRPTPHDRAGRCRSIDEPCVRGPTTNAAGPAVHRTGHVLVPAMKFPGSCTAVQHLSDLIIIWVRCPSALDHIQYTYKVINRVDAVPDKSADSRSRTQSKHQNPISMSGVPRPSQPDNV
jgi:hypothetical protein